MSGKGAKVKKTSYNKLCNKNLYSEWLLTY